MSKTEIVLRADHGPGIGLGHAMRCLAIGESWVRLGGKATIAARGEFPAVRSRFRRVGIDYVGIESTCQPDREAGLLRELCSDKGWIVVDGYHFSQDYLSELHGTCGGLMVIDDTGHLRSYPTDILLNQNLGAHEIVYNIPRDAITLLGPRYALLRGNFTSRAGDDYSTREVGKRVLVLLGGGAQHFVLEKILSALDQLASRRPLSVRILIGPHALGEIHTALCARPGWRFLKDVEDVGEHMHWADLAISAAGSTCWELAYVGLPSLLIILAENQAGIAHALDAQGAARCMGWAKDLVKETIASEIAALLDDWTSRDSMSKLARALVDGRGVLRVLAAMGLVNSETGDRCLGLS